MANLTSKLRKRGYNFFPLYLNDNPQTPPNVLKRGYRFLETFKLRKRATISMFHYICFPELLISRCIYLIVTLKHIQTLCSFSEALLSTVLAAETSTHPRTIPSWLSACVRVRACVCVCRQSHLPLPHFPPTAGRVPDMEQLERPSLRLAERPILP